MPPSVRQMISDATDFDLCNGVFQRIMDSYGNVIDASALPQEHRTVMLVWHAMGIIGNGGFNYLFEGYFPGDPHFALTAKAFHAIDCELAAKAFQRALDLFPNSQPPADIERRLRMYRRGTGETRHDIDSQFWNANHQIETCLAAYIRNHGERFESLDDARPKPPDREELAPEPVPSVSTIDISSLPHWARVAFAARCARRVLPVFDANWGDASAERRNTLTIAITCAENSAANGAPDENLKGAVLNALITAGAALRTLYGSPSKDAETAPPDGNAAVLASLAAKAAEKAAETAQSKADESDTVAFDAFGFARKALSDDDVAIAEIYGDADRLQAIARKRRWTHQTPVPTTVFGFVTNDESAPAEPWWKFW